MGGAGFEPAKAVPPDLQSGPFGRLGIHPLGARFPSFLPVYRNALPILPKGNFPETLQASRITELAERLELSTLGLQNRCSAD